MKTLKYILCVLAIFLSGCAEHNELDVDFSVPTELSGPAEVPGMEVQKMVASYYIMYYLIH